MGAPVNWRVYSMRGLGVCKHGQLEFAQPMGGRGRLTWMSNNISLMSREPNYTPSEPLACGTEGARPAADAHKSADVPVPKDLALLPDNQTAPARFGKMAAETVHAPKSKVSDAQAKKLGQAADKMAAELLASLKGNGKAAVDCAHQANATAADTKAEKAKKAADAMAAGLLASLDGHGRTAVDAATARSNVPPR